MKDSTSKMAAVSGGMYYYNCSSGPSGFLPSHFLFLAKERVGRYIGGWGALSAYSACCSWIFGVVVVVVLQKNDNRTFFAENGT